MRIAATDEYGLRIILRIARDGGKAGLNIPQLSELEDMSHAYVAKITRQLRLGGLIVSTPGQKGGYILAKPASEISILEIIKSLDGPFYDKSFCQAHSNGQLGLCTNSVDCSVRSLWKILQYSMDKVLGNITLEELLKPETETHHDLTEKVNKTILI